ncbi:metal-dependent hydrolase [Candidatus Woesearchaeota archaeon]|nr:metal-dependent hydrolase [Candidatus Woesearchaeota archaeon]
MFYTHVAFALMASLVSAKYLHPSSLVLFIFVACFVSLVPDIDNRDSKIGKHVKFISKIFDHRGILHTIFPPIGLFLLFNYLSYNLLGIAALVGYSSHILIDAFTPEGINFLHPFTTFRVSGFIKTGTFLEIILFLLLSGFDVFYLLKMVL